ncbi:MAG TPA: hypothetical protein VM260_01855, partial [Pirellula sp.]|nr:hypothetical protein [Pirellula sp.]
KQLAIQARVRNQMADVQVTQSFVNKSSTTIQAQFVFRSNTLYKRGKLVVTPETASLDLERDKDKIKKLKRFSEEYFALVKDNKESENQVLSQQSNDDQLLVLIRGVNYLIE